MRILIAGATGLIGSKLVSLCHEHGIDVNFLTTRKNKIEHSESYQGFYWNPRRGYMDKNALSEVEVIVNLAGTTISKRWTRRNKRQILESRVNTARILLESLQENAHKINHYISASGIGVYPSSFDHLYHECYQGFSPTFPGTVVKQWEGAADGFSSLGIKVTKVRTGIVLSQQGGALPKLLRPIKMGFGAPLGSGEQWQSWIHIEDIAGIYLHLIKNRLDGIFNAVSPNPVTNKKMTQVIASMTNQSIWLPNVPGFVLKMVLGEMAQLVLESQLVSAERIMESGYTFNYVNLENALENLLEPQ